MPRYAFFSGNNFWKFVCVHLCTDNTQVHIVSSHNRIQKSTATIRLDTSPVAFLSGFFTKSMGQPVQFGPSFSRTPPPQTHIQPRSDLVPEFDLSIPTTGDDLGGFMRMPQGANAHLVMSLDPVVKFGGLPIPDIQLSVCISWHHITVGKDKRERLESSTLWLVSSLHLPKGRSDFFWYYSQPGIALLPWILKES